VSPGSPGPITISALAVVTLIGCAGTTTTPLTTADALRRHVELLASEELAGRGTLQPGGAMAEQYIAGVFAGAGLEPLPGRDSYFIPYPLYRQGFDPDRSWLEVGGDDGITAGAGVDFRPFSFSDEGEASGPVIFGGYGIHAPDLGYDDFDGLDVEGRLVFILRHEPGEDDPESPFDGTDSSGHATFLSKAGALQERGAAGMILVTDPLHHGPSDDLSMDGSLSRTPPEDDPGDGDGEDDEAPFLAIHVSRAVADRLVAGAGRSLADIQRGLDDGSLHARDVDLAGVEARVVLERRERAEEVTLRNVAGILRGSDPVLRDEMVVLVAHHDHLGGFEGEGDTVYNGADDNASGTAAILELARAFGARGPARRSLVFVTFSAEERGLLGSRSMVDRNQLDVERVVFLLNLDMIGRNPDEPIAVMGDGFSPGIEQVLARANRGLDLRYDLAGTGYSGNSDHDPFFDRGVPFVNLFSGFHPDYHQLTDHPDKLSYERMARITELTGRVAVTVAEASRPPAFVHHVGWLGARLEVDPSRGEGAVVRRVDPDSRAEQGGLDVRQRVVAVDGAPIVTRNDLARALAAIEPGSVTLFDVVGPDGGQELRLERARTGYLGVATGTVDEDVRAELGLLDEGVLIRRASPDGPAGSAGVQSGDILISLAGRPVSFGSLRSVLAQIGAGETVDAVIIRDGQRQTVEITLGERPRRR